MKTSIAKGDVDGSGLVLIIDTLFAQEPHPDDVDEAAWVSDCHLYCSFAPGLLPMTLAQYEVPAKPSPGSISKKPAANRASYDCHD